MSILRVHDGPSLADQLLYRAGHTFVKTAGDAEVVYNLAGMLYLAPNGYLLLSVPNALVRGVFSALHEPGAELPLHEGRLVAHVTVMSKEEVEAIGPDRISERGKQFRYTFGRFKRVDPDGWPEMRSAFFITVHSPELQSLRRSYGLSSLPNNGQYEFHITVAVVRRGVLGRNETAKGDSAAQAVGTESPAN